MTSKWATAPLATVCEVKRGETITRTQTTTGKVPVIAGGLKPAYFHGMSNRPTGAITVSGSGANAGSVAIWEEEIWASDCSTVISKNPELSQKFVFYFLKANETFIKTELRQGAAQPHVYAKDLAALEILLPPLDEQKRIVAKLDEALGYVENLMQLIEMKLSQEDLLERSFISYLMNKAQERSKRVSLKNVAQTSYGYTESASRETLGPKFLRITDIQEGAVDWEKVPYCPISEDDFNKYKLRPGDIVFARTGATTGKSFLIGECPEAVAASYLIRVRPDSGIVSPSYLAAYFRSSEYWIAINDGATGSAQGGFNASKLGELEVPILEDMKMQMDLVDKLADFDHRLDGLRSKTKGMLTDCNQLRSSILSAAFAGDF